MRVVLQLLFQLHHQLAVLDADVHLCKVAVAVGAAAVAAAAAAAAAVGLRHLVVGLCRANADGLVVCHGCNRGQERHPRCER